MTSPGDIVTKGATQTLHWTRHRNGNKHLPYLKMMAFLHPYDLHSHIYISIYPINQMLCVLLCSSENI